MNIIDSENMVSVEYGDKDLTEILIEDLERQCIEYIREKDKGNLFTH